MDTKIPQEILKSLREFAEDIEPKRNLFGFAEAIEFLREQNDPRFAAIERLLLEQKSKLARQHERILKLESRLSPRQADP